MDIPVSGSIAFSEFIDVHTHILPGLDDGPKDYSESFDMARCYESVGIKRIIATPHFLPGTAWAPTKEIVLAAVNTLQQSLCREHIGLIVEPGMEIAYHKKLEEHIIANDLLPLGQSEYFLIEPSFHGRQDDLLACLSSLLDRGRKLILAHPERVEGFSLMLGRLRVLVEQGLLVQVNSASFLGYLGENCKGMAELLWQNKCLHLIASDAHDKSKRTPLTVYEWANLLGLPEGEEMIDLCSKNIRKLFPVI